MNEFYNYWNCAPQMIVPSNDATLTVKTYIFNNLFKI